MELDCKPRAEQFHCFIELHVRNCGRAQKRAGERDRAPRRVTLALFCRFCYCYIYIYMYIYIYI